MELSNLKMADLKPVKLFLAEREGHHTGGAHIASMDWSLDGEILLCLTEAGKILIYRTSYGDLARRIDCPTARPYIAKFSNYEASDVFMACSSWEADDQSSRQYSVRIWSMLTNRFTRCFSVPASIKEGTGLQLHPTERLFMVSCNDQHIRIFDIKHGSPMAIIKSSLATPVIAFDTEGFVFASSLDGKQIHLFTINIGSMSPPTVEELKCYDCEKLLIDEAVDDTIETLTFSPDSNYFAVTTSHMKIVGFHALYGQKICDYLIPSQFQGSKSHASTKPCSISIPVYTPDARYLLCAIKEDIVFIHIWAVTGGWIAKFPAGHLDVPTAISFNPKKAILASGALEIIWWEPPEPS